MASMLRRVAAACDASSVTLSTARARPWYVVRHGTWCGSWQKGSPFPTPSTRAGPEVTLKLTLNAPAALPPLPCTTTPAASTSVARTSATSWPSSSTLVPVAVLRDGASSVSTMAAAAPALTRVARATTAPAPSSASAVTL